MFPTGGSSDIISLINTLVFLVLMFFIFTGLNQKFQMALWIRNIRNYLLKIEKIAADARKQCVESLRELGFKGDPEKFVEKFIEFFIIEPVSDEPIGLMKRLEHLLDTRNMRFKNALARALPNTSKYERYNAEVILEVAIALTYIYRIVRHYLILGQKTNNWVLIMQLELQMPQIMRIAETYYRALEAFKEVKPIGDSIGPLVAAKLMKFNSNKRTIVEDTIVAEVERKGRKLLIVKAEGPGSNVGKPGEAIKRLVEAYQGKIARIVMIDAALKLEGEKSGEVIEGVGAAIGDPGPEKFKIENVAADYNIPLDSIVIKESLEEAITTMRKEISEAADKVIETIDNILEERTKPGDVVIIAGIGNTVGVAQ